MDLIPANVRNALTGALSLIIVIVSVVAAILSQVAAPDQGSPQPPANNNTVVTKPVNRNVTQQQLIDATNAYRAQKGLPALKPMPALNNVAQDWANRMARENRLYHRPNFSAHYPSGWRLASENVLQNNRGATAQDLVSQWSRSPGHNANMLNPSITHIGVGVAYSQDGKLWAVQNFAQY